MQKIFADAGYAGKFIDAAKAYGSWILEIVKRPRATTTFTILPKRWIVERTFGWFNRYRRLSKDYEFNAESSETMLYIAMINLMVHRLAAE